LTHPSESGLADNFGFGALLVKQLRKRVSLVQPMPTLLQLPIFATNLCLTGIRVSRFWAPPKSRPTA
jgi:hypothetical protein